MELVNIPLLEEGEDAASLRTRNADGQKARNMLIDRGNSLILQAALTSVTHGDFTPDGDGASFLIFDFNFIGKGERRFTSGEITITFEDASQDTRNCPMVVTISPAGRFAINKTTSTRDIHQGLNATLGAGAGVATGELGFIWEQTEARKDHHATTLVGLKRSLGVSGGKNNAVTWRLEEDPKTQEGIPSFLRGCVLLRRRADVPFRFTIDVKSDVDFGGKLRRFFGLEKPDPVDPVELDGETDLEDLGISRLSPDTPGLDLRDMASMDSNEIVILTSISKLVIVHGITDSTQCQSEVNEFWQATYPKALITTFPFFHEDIAWGNRGFVESAERLLTKVQDDRSNELDIPCVALCHELGGCLVQKALLMASRDKKYYNFSTRLVNIIFCNTPNFMDENVKTENYVLQLLSKSDVGSHSPLSLMKELPPALDSLCWEYAGISNQYRVTTYKTTWNATFGDDSTEVIVGVVDRAVNDQLRAISQYLLSFLHIVSEIDTNNHQLRLTKPIIQSKWWNAESSAYERLKSLEESAPNILHVYNIPESGSATLASQLFFEMRETFEDGILVTYALQKHDIRTQSVKAFFVSLIRQILQSRPSLFNRVTAIAERLQEDKTFSCDVLQIVLLTLLRASINIPAVLIFSRCQRSNSCLVENLTTVFKECQKSATGRFKIIILTEGTGENHLDLTQDICCGIDASAEEISDRLRTEFVSSKMRSLLRSRPQWKLCSEAIVEKLATAQSFVHAGLMLTCLDTMNIASTQNAMEEAVKLLPGTVEQAFVMTINRCVETSGLDIQSLMQWILHAVRPLTVAELSVVAGLSVSDNASIDDLKQNLPSNIFHDLEGPTKTLIDFAGVQVLPTFGGIGHYVVDNQSANPHSMILSKCITYLEALFDYGAAQSDASEYGNVPEAELLEYAVTEWPRHYNLVPASCSTKDCVLRFLGTEEYVQAWFKHYQKYTNFPIEAYYKLDNELKIACWFGLLDVAKMAIARTKENGDSGNELTQALDLAAGNGQANMVNLLLEAGASYEFGLCWASEGGFNDIVATLLNIVREGIDKRDKRGVTSLILGLLRGNQKIAAYLLEKSANPRLTAGFGINALHVAAMTGQVAIVQKLIDAEVDVKAVTDGDESALRLATAGGFVDIVKLLLPHETDIDGTNKDGMTVLQLAARYGHTSVCDLLFRAGANLRKPTSLGFSVLHLAAKHGFVDVVRWLFSKQFTLAYAQPVTDQVNGGGKKRDGEDNEVNEQVNKTNEEYEEEEEDEQKDSTSHTSDEKGDDPSPMELAAVNGHIEVVQELLEREEFNTEQDRSLSLVYASREGYVDIVEEIVKFGKVTAIQTPGGNTALHMAARNQYLPIVLQLLKVRSDGKATFDVNEKNKAELTPLHMSVISTRHGTMTALLDNGARIAEKEITGQTVFHFVANFGHVSVLKALWNKQKGKHDEKQSIWLSPTETGVTPLAVATRNGNVDMMAAMIDKVPSSSTKIAKLQGDVSNALIIAAREGRLDAVELLLSHDWDVNSTDVHGDGALHHAAEHGHTSIIECLIAKGANLNLRGAEGRMPLHYAVAHSSDGVEALLENDITDIDGQDEKGKTPIWQASWSGKVDCVKLLLQRSPKLNVIDSSNNWTALHAAYDNPEITKLLLDAGADPTICGPKGYALLPFVSNEPNALETVQHYLHAGLDPNIRNSNGYTAAHVAAEYDNLGILKLLKDSGADIAATTEQGDTALHLAAAQGHQDIVHFLLDCGLDVNQHSKDLGTPLMTTGRYSKAQTVKILIERGADINATSQDFRYHTALQAAALAAKDTDTVQVLLDGKADVNLMGGEFGSALCAAAWGNSHDVAVLLLDAGARLDYDEGPVGTALECALFRQSWDVATLCLERNADVNKVSKGKRGTALLAAIHNENWEMIQDLLNRGADPNSGPKGGDVPTQAAIRKGREKLLEVILDKGGSLSFRDKYGRGAVSTAMVHNSIGLLSCLWGRNGIDVNERDAAKRTPLMLAVLRGVNVIQDLCKNGAKLDLQDQWGNTALIYSIVRDYQPLTSELIECGASLSISDVRQRDALYWACRQSSSDTFNKVYEAMKTSEAVPGSFQGAMNAAVSSGQSSMVETLLDNIKYSQKQTDDDGWTARHCALRYDRLDIDEVIKAAIVDSGQKVADLLPIVKLPTEWHESDLSMGLLRGADTRVLTISKTFEPLKTDHPKALARSNHPMWPQKHDVYYFEIAISNQGEDERISFAVGFCDETTSLGVHLGWTRGSWGYRGDDGKSYHDGNSSLFGPTFGPGDVIGCGINFTKQIAFYTKNGEIIGRAFTNVRGKIYPAISVDIRMTNYEISARFWEDEEIGNKDFMFKGPFDDPATFVESERGAADTETDEDSESDRDSVTTGTDSSWFSSEE